MRKFKLIYDLLMSLANEPSTKEKVKMLKINDSKFLREFLFLALDYRMIYNLQKLPKSTSAGEESWKQVKDYLFYLSAQTGTKKDEALELSSMCASKEARHVVQCILEKDIKCGVGSKLVNKALGEGTIIEHSPMLCYYAARYNNRSKSFSSDLDTFVEKCGGWKNILVSTKENGVRIWADSIGNYTSRNGINFPNFSVFDYDMEICINKIAADFGVRPESVIIDAEIVSIDDDFQKQMTQVRRLKNADPSIFRMKIFDFIIAGEKILQSERSSYLENILAETLKKESTITSVLAHTRIKDFAGFRRIFLNVVNNGGEGLVLKDKRGVYELKRSANWCKVKNFYSADFKVVGFTISTKGKNKGRLKNLIVEYDYRGEKVRTSVGSGYDKKELVDFVKKQPKMIEVEYFNITKDGKLFHPTYQRIKQDGI